MTKRSRDSITTSSHLELSDRQASNDAEAVGSQEDADGSALKKARSFMATLVSEQEWRQDDLINCARLAMCVARGRQDATRIDQNVVSPTWDEQLQTSANFNSRILQDHGFGVYISGSSRYKKRSIHGHGY
jgi:hypothetical protein